MRGAVIVDAVRTPIGKGRATGALAEVHPTDLSAHVLKTLAERTGLGPALVDDVAWGCVSQIGEQAGSIGRYAVLAAGWPEHVPGLTIDRQCGSSQQAVHQVAAGVIAGQYDIAVAAGNASQISDGAAALLITTSEIALGHPLGASGARLMTTLVHHMRDNGIRFGLQAMCEAGGMANATVLELI